MADMAIATMTVTIDVHVAQRRLRRLRWLLTWMPWLPYVIPLSWVTRWLERGVTVHAGGGG